MKTAKSPNTVSFTAKGQVVIPSRLRREFRIEPGTKAVIEATSEGILLKPMTRQAIARLHGILKRAPGEKPLAEEWAKHKAEESKLEDQKPARPATREPKHGRRGA
jgi:AbrB family looped-hinge helix DNA binding protein